MISLFQRFVPYQIKSLLKSHYRFFFPQKLHVILFVTFRCNYKCSYCLVRTESDLLPLFPKPAEKTARQWLTVLEKLPPAAIYISGGEPFLYEGIVELVNCLPAKHDLVGAVSNISVDPRIYKKIRKRMHLNVSFHREFVEQEAFLSRVKELQPFFHLTVNFVATPENLAVLPQTWDFFKRHGIDLHVDPFIDNAGKFVYSEKQLEILSRFIPGDRGASRRLYVGGHEPKKCSAGRNYINIMPDGRVFTCTGGSMYTLSPERRGAGQQGSPDYFEMRNIFDEDFELNRGDVICSLPCKDACDYDAAIIRKV